MEVGILANRYAKAFLEYITPCEKSEKIVEQVKQLVEQLSCVPDLQSVLQDLNANISTTKKLELIKMAITDVEPEFENFLKLLIKKERIQELKLILLRFLDLYNERKHIKEVLYITAEDSPEYDEEIKAYIKERTSCEIILKKKVDPKLIAGFILQIDDNKLDTSILYKIKQMRKELTEKNRRIV